ncbi:hypothetical protein EHW90_12645 [Lachnoanaerobaculum orale]|jgi:hypothetical protein|uniref:Uncharacterized protein n=1 Tax=Lachnoanaerobaculum orale TaxID=979627 RepID=A0A3P3PX88_9FIRM|nr:hypothetical protein [Lachnoanaerobaculum orale]RRJ13582.1 hypothetical protein EHW90_12645 [Lachnoanaerobaculum orale]
MKKTVLAVLVAVMAMSSGITAFAYWKSELKVKANIPVVYDVDIEMSGDVKGQEKVDPADKGDITIRPDQGKKSSSESVQEESTANTEEQTIKESIQNKPSIEETKESIIKSENNTESKAEADTNNEEIKR